MNGSLCLSFFLFCVCIHDDRNCNMAKGAYSETTTTKKENCTTGSRSIFPAQQPCKVLLVFGMHAYTPSTASGCFYLSFLSFLLLLFLLLFFFISLMVVVCSSSISSIKSTSSRVWKLEKKKKK